MAGVWLRKSLLTPVLARLMRVSLFYVDGHRFVLDRAVRADQ